MLGMEQVIAPATAAAPMTVKPLIYACKTCHTRFPHRYGYRTSVTRWASPFADVDGVEETLWFIVSLPLAVAFAAIWIPMEIAAPPCPMCGTGIIRRDEGT